MQPKPLNFYERPKSNRTYHWHRYDQLLRLEPQWSTYDVFSVFDCSESSPKWRHFTGLHCSVTRCDLQIVCRGIECKCCEQIQCQDSLAKLFQRRLSGPEVEVVGDFENGTALIQNCTTVTLGDQFSQACRGDCQAQDAVQLGRLLNRTACHRLDCELDVQCTGLTCRCCKLIWCVVDVNSIRHDINGRPLTRLHREDRNIALVSKVSYF